MSLFFDPNMNAIELLGQVYQKYKADTPPVYDEIADHIKTNENALVYFRGSLKSIDIAVNNLPNLAVDQSSTLLWDCGVSRINQIYDTAFDRLEIQGEYEKLLKRETIEKVFDQHDSVHSALKALFSELNKKKAIEELKNIFAEKFLVDLYLEAVFIEKKTLEQYQKFITSKRRKY